MKLATLVCLLALSSAALADTPDTPVALENMQPHPSNFYPEDSIRAGEQGHAIVKVTISAAGKAQAVIEKSSGFKRLDAAGVMYMEHTRWIAATHNGKPCAATLHVPITWSLYIAPDMTGFNAVHGKVELK